MFTQEEIRISQELDEILNQFAKSQNESIKQQLEQKREEMHAAIKKNAAPGSHELIPCPL